MIRKRAGMTIAELLITMLIFSIFLIVLFSSLNIVINAMETQDMIVSKLYTASKVNFLFGILEDEFKWLGSFANGVAELGAPFDVGGEKGFEITPTPGSSDVIFEYQYAVIENLVLQKKENDVYEIVFPEATATSIGGEYKVILSDEKMADTATATIDGFGQFLISASDSTVTLLNPDNPESHPATKIYFVRIREGNSIVKPTDEDGNTDYLEQLVRGRFFYDDGESKIFLNIRKGFSAFNSTMTVLDNVDNFQMSFFEDGWKNYDDADTAKIRAIKVDITLNIPVSKSIQKRCEEGNMDMIQLTKERVFWLPDEDL